MVKLVHDVGVSNVGATKARRKAGIAPPGRVHWLKSKSSDNANPSLLRLQVLDVPPRPARLALIRTHQ